MCPFFNNPDSEEPFSIPETIEMLEEGKKKIIELFQLLDNSPTISTNITYPEYLASITEVLYKNEPAHIFIYHQWLDKQNFEIENKEFLIALREDVMNILSKKGIENPIVNWLIHDADILPITYNDLFYFQHQINIQLPSTYPEHSWNDYIPQELENDNIWCFIHEEIEGYLYKDIILDFGNPAYLWNAEALYKRLIIDFEKCEERFNILRYSEDQPLDEESWKYILGKNPDDLTTLFNLPEIQTFRELKNLLNN